MKYDRQSAIIGDEGQKKLANSHVAIAGCGGLGCNVVTQLAMAGVGKFTLIDFDQISESDLNRQFVHSGNEGLKTKSMKQWISKLSQCDVRIINEKLTEENVIQFIKDADLVIDCLDNNNSRLILNDGIVKKNVPLIHGAVNGMHGHVTFILPKKTPCLACFLGEGEKNNSSLRATVSIICSFHAGQAI